MSANRLLAILALVAERAESGSATGSLCAIAAEFTRLDGAHIVLRHDTQPLTAYCASDEWVSSLVDLEITLGEGPATDACASSDSVLVSNLARESSGRWVSYPALAEASRVAAAFSFPVQVGAIRLGALTLFRRTPGSLSPDQESDAYLAAAVVARAILNTQAGAADQTLLDVGDETSHFDFVIHQAAGMVAVQGSFGVSDALVALRAHAFATGVGLSELSSRVVDRRLRYSAAFDRWIPDVEESDDFDARSE